MLQNKYFLAKIGADTAENEQHFAENVPKIGNYPTGPPAGPGAGPRDGSPEHVHRALAVSDLRRSKMRAIPRALYTSFANFFSA